MASDPITWEDLIISIEAWSGDDADASRFEEAVALAERFFQRKVFCPEREASTTLAFTSGTKALPTDFWGVRTAYLDGTTDSPLVQVTPDRLHEMYPGTQSGTPRNFAIEGENMLLGPVPSAASVALTYWQTIPALGTSQATNWLLTDHPDLYLNKTLEYVFAFNRDWEASNRHRGLAQEILVDVNKSGRRRNINSGPLVARARRTDQVLAYP